MGPMTSDLLAEVNLLPGDRILKSACRGDWGSLGMANRCERKNQGQDNSCHVPQPVNAKDNKHRWQSSNCTKNTNKTESSTMHHNSLIGRPQNGEFAPMVNLSRNHDKWLRDKSLSIMIDNDHAHRSCSSMSISLFLVLLTMSFKWSSLHHLIMLFNLAKAKSSSANDTHPVQSILWKIKCRMHYEVYKKSIRILYNTYYSVIIDHRTPTKFW